MQATVTRRPNGLYECRAGTSAWEVMATGLLPDGACSGAICLGRGAFDSDARFEAFVNVVRQALTDYRQAHAGQGMP